MNKTKQTKEEPEQKEEVVSTNNEQPEEPVTEQKTKQVPEQPKKDAQVMFSMTQENNKVFSDYVTAISKLINEATFKVSPNGIELVAMDPSNVAMVIWNFNKEMFEEFTEVNREFLLNLINLKDIQKRTKKGTVSYLVGDSVIITAKDKSTKKFTMPILDEMEGDKSKIPELNHKSNVTIDVTEFKDMIDDATITGESVTFKINNKKFTCNSKGDVTESLIDFTGINAEGDNAVSKYSIDYLKKMVMKPFKEVNIKFNDDYPLALDYKETGHSIRLILAPRVESD